MYNSVSAFKLNSFIDDYTQTKFGGYIGITLSVCLSVQKRLTNNFWTII